MLGSRRSTFDATAEVLLQILGQCPICSASLDDHSLAHFACTRVSAENQEEMGKFTQLFEAENWKQLIEMQDFDPMLDTLVVFAHRCSVGKYAAFLTHDPYELYADTALVQWRILSEESGRELYYVTQPSSWRPYLLKPTP